MTVWRTRRRLLKALPLAAWAARARAGGPGDPAGSFWVTASDGARLNVLQAGPAQPDPSLPVIVLVPGWCMPATIWQAQLAGLGRRFRTLAVDPRGQGASEVPAGGYEARQRASDLYDVLTPLSRVVLVGWSLGGLDALDLVHWHGHERLAGLVLVDNSVGEPPAPRPSHLIERLRSDRRATLDRFVRGLFAQARPEAQIALIEQSALRMPLEASIALLSYPFPREHWRNIARSFPKPLCYCVTSHYLEQARNLRRERPATQVQWFEHAGHALFVDEADRFNRVIAQFASGV